LSENFCPVFFKRRAVLPETLQHIPSSQLESSRPIACGCNLQNHVLEFQQADKACATLFPGKASDMKRKTLYLAIVVVIVGLFSLIFTATAQRQPESSTQPQNRRQIPQRQEDFDIRASLNRSLPALPVETKAVEGRQLVPARNSRLRRERPNVELQFSNLSNAPSRVYSFTQNLTQSTADIEAGARFFLKQNSDLYQLRDDEVDGLRIARRYKTDHNGVTHLTLQQEVNGIEVFQSDYSFHFDRFGSLITAGGELIPAAARSANFARPRLTANAAFRQAAAFADVELTGEATIKASAAGRALKQKLSLPCEIRARHRSPFGLLPRP
jgi:hypothetical protein